MNFKVSHIFLIPLFLLRFPFQQNTIYEYFLEIVLNVLLGYVNTVTVVATFTFFANSCLLIEAGQRHCNLIFTEINQLSIKGWEKNSADIKAKYVNVIELHIELNRCVRPRNQFLTEKCLTFFPLIFQIGGFTCRCHQCNAVFPTVMQYFILFGLGCVYRKC